MDDLETRARAARDAPGGRHHGTVAAAVPHRTGRTSGGIVAGCTGAAGRRAA
jgi:hypothetical protein